MVAQPERLAELVRRNLRMVRSHRELILSWLRARGQFSNGIVKGFNDKARVATKKRLVIAPARRWISSCIMHLAISRIGTHPQILLTRPNFDHLASEAYPVEIGARSWHSRCLPIRAAGGHRAKSTLTRTDGFAARPDETDHAHGAAHIAD